MTRDGSQRKARTFARQVFTMARLALFVVSAAACRSGDDSPDARIRATIARAEAFAEVKDLGGLKDLVSNAYHDDAGQDKRAILGLLFMQFRKHESIHLLTRIDRVDVQPPQATATVFTAMAGPFPASTTSPPCAPTSIDLT